MVSQARRDDDDEDDFIAEEDTGNYRNYVKVPVL